MNLSAKKYLLNKMNATANKVQLGTLLDGDYSSETFNTSGTLSYLKLHKPAASAALTSITRHVLYAFGEITGTTAIGFGDTTKSTYGVMCSFGRTAIAESTFSGTDTALDVRAINKLANDAAYNLQGAYIKAKNYSGGTVGALTGLFVECVADGTESSAVAIKVRSDGTAIDYALDMYQTVVTNGADIRLSSGITIGSGSGVPSHSAGQGSLYIRTGQAVGATLYLNTNGSTGWTLLNAVT